MAKRHPIQVPDNIWRKLWEEARKRKEPASPAQVAREILQRHFEKKPSK